MLFCLHVIYYRRSGSVHEMSPVKMMLVLEKNHYLILPFLIKEWLQQRTVVLIQNNLIRLVMDKIQHQVLAQISLTKVSEAFGSNIFIDASYYKLHNSDFSFARTQVLCVEAASGTFSPAEVTWSFIEKPWKKRSSTIFCMACNRPYCSRILSNNSPSYGLQFNETENRWQSVCYIEWFYGK